MTTDNQPSVFDLLEDSHEDSPPPLRSTLAPKCTPEEMGAALRREIPTRANYVHLAWHRGGASHVKMVSSRKTSQVAKNELGACRKTEYVIPIPLPDDWLKDPALHEKAMELEIILLAEKGFMVCRGGIGKEDRWETMPTVDSMGRPSQAHTDQWKVDACLCPGCGWLKNECKCEVVVK